MGAVRGPLARGRRPWRSSRGRPLAQGERITVRPAGEWRHRPRAEHLQPQREVRLRLEPHRERGARDPRVLCRRHRETEPVKQVPEQPLPVAAPVPVAVPVVTASGRVEVPAAPVGVEAPGVETRRRRPEAVR